MGLTDHFTMTELTASIVAERKGINNTAPDSLMPHLFILAVGLEQIRKLLGGHPIKINSAYRCEALNTEIGGAKNSAHLDGYAADFTCSVFGSPRDICEAVITAGIKFDQIIDEGTWVHVSFAPAMRGEVLTAHRTPRSTTSYTRGLT